MASTFTTANITSRPFRDDTDFWRIRSLAIETYPISGPGWNWDLRRWDGSRFYNPTGALNPKWQQTIRVWETAEGKLVGTANFDGSDLFYLQIHPDYRKIEEEMIAWAEENLAVLAPNAAHPEINTEVFEYDTLRQRILEQRGYAKTPYFGFHRLMHLGNRAIPAPDLAEGYTMREIQVADLEDCQRLADLLNAAFNRTFHNALEFYQFAKYAPSVRQDLHLVTVAPDGSFTAHVAVIYDEANRRGLYEPVCTHPAHRRKGLANSLMLECLRRLQALGACRATVETGDMIPANGLYESFGFTETYPCWTWRKVC